MKAVLEERKVQNYAAFFSPRLSELRRRLCGIRTSSKCRGKKQIQTQNNILIINQVPYRQHYDIDTTRCQEFQMIIKKREISRYEITAHRISRRSVRQSVTAGTDGVAVEVIGSMSALGATTNAEDRTLAGVGFVTVLPPETVGVTDGENETGLDATLEPESFCPTGIEADWG